MKHVLILGANGVLGSEITRQLNCIVDSGIPYTLIRTADLTEADSMEYHLHKAGEKAHSRYVSRAAVANLIIKIIMSDDELGLNESIGITD